MGGWFQNALTGLCELLSCIDGAASICRLTTNSSEEAAVPTHFYKMILRCNSTAADNTTAIPGCNGVLSALAFVFPHNLQPECRVSIVAMNTSLLSLHKLILLNTLRPTQQQQLQHRI